jgi:hypothetical protein
VKTKEFAIALLAGLASALMAAGGMYFVLLAFFAPLPLFIIAFTTGFTGAVVSAGSASLAVGLAFEPLAGVTFFLSNGLAPILLARFGLQSRPASGNRPREGELSDGTREWYPEGRMLLICAAAAAATAVFNMLLHWGNMDAFHAALRENLVSLLEASVAPEDRPALYATIDSVVRLAPIISAAMLLLFEFLSLRLAMGVLRLSGNSLRPFAPFRAMRLPIAAAYGLPVLALAALLPGMAGLVCAIVAACLAMALSLTGLAVLHGLLEESRAKGPLLFALYFALSIFPPILVLLAGLGFADAFTDLRGRKAPANPS